MKSRIVVFLIALLHVVVGPNAQGTANLGLVPEAPGRPLVLEFSSRSANLSWAPPYNEAKVSVSHYVLHIRRGETGDWDQSLETETNSTFYQVNDLAPFTTYSFRVSAVSPHGASPLSQVSFYMLTQREAPSGKPTITAAHNTSSTSLQLSWRPPPPATLNGEFLGYRVSYRPRHSNASHLISEAFITDPDVNQFLIKGLTPFTQYLVALQVRNPAGLGPPTKVVIMTDEGVPSQPLDVTFRNVTSSSVDVSWSQPEELNGVITGYRLYYMHNNFTDVQTVQASALTAQMQITLSSLKAYETYTIWLRAFTWKHEGASSESFEVLTDVQGPEKSVITNISCSNGLSLSLRWLMPNCRCKFVEFFVLHHIEKNGLVTEDIIIENKKNTPLRYIEYIMNNLSTEYVHEFRVCGATRSIYNGSVVLYGEFSKTHQVYWPSQCDAGASFVSTADVQQEDYRKTGIIVAAACALAAISFVVISIIMWKKCCMASYYFLTESPSSLETTISVVGSASNSTLMFAGSSIPVCSFNEYVSSMHANQNSGFWQKFQTLSDKCSLTHSLMHCHTTSKEATLRSSENTSCADDGGELTRFCMNTLTRKDSVLFSFVDGYNMPNAYIAAQGPLNINNELFWQFAWKQGVAAIVTISSQNMDVICEYNSYVSLEVSLLHESYDSSYAVRVLQLTSKDKNLDFESRDILYFQYNAWPHQDENLQNSIQDIIRFIEMAAVSKRELLGPVLVYSSCGVSPVGLYILSDAMLKQMEVQGRVDIDGYITHIQRQSSFPLIQTSHHYIFVHDLLSQAVSARFLHAQ